MNTRFETVSLPLDIPFEIARGTTETAENVIVEIEHDGEIGYGAAAPSRRYGETTATVEGILPELLDVVETVGDPHARRTIADRMRTVTRENPAAKAAVDIALWDLVGKLLSQPVYRLLGCSAAGDDRPPTSFTIGIDDTETMVERAREAAAAEYPVLKLKLGTDRDIEIVSAIRKAVPEAILRVDANEAWTPKEAVEKCRKLDSYGVEFVEQPVGADDPKALRYVYERSPLPIAADESCRTPADVPAIADRCDIANLKLMKTGGLTPAVELIHAARAHELDVMCGCMIETNASIAAATHLLPLLDYADLDGSLLLESDPYAGAPVSAGRFEVENVDRGTGATLR